MQFADPTDDNVEHFKHQREVQCPVPNPPTTELTATVISPVMPLVSLLDNPNWNAGHLATETMMSHGTSTNQSAHRFNAQ